MVSDLRCFEKLGFAQNGCEVHEDYQIIDWVLSFELFVKEINNELEVFVQILKTDVGFCNNRGRRPRLLQNSNEVWILKTYIFKLARTDILDVWVKLWMIMQFIDN